MKFHFFAAKLACEAVALFFGGLLKLLKNTGENVGENN